MGSKLLLGLPQQTAELFPLPLATEVGSQLRARHTGNQTGASKSVCVIGFHLLNCISSAMLCAGTKQSAGHK